MIGNAMALHDATGLGALVGEKYLDVGSGEAWTGQARAELDAGGTHCLEGFLREAALKAIQAEVLELEKQAKPSDKSGNRKYSVKGDMLEGTLIQKIAKSDYMAGIANAILRPGRGLPNHLSSPVAASEIKCGLNIMRGPGDITNFHFDDTALNMLIPVFLPSIDGPKRGQLKIYPNLRSFRKDARDQWAIPAVLRLKPLRRLFESRSREIEYRLGNAYLFYGYRSFHGVESPSAPGLRCVTNVGIADRKRFLE
jgi:hypothetical protein